LNILILHKAISVLILQRMHTFVVHWLIVSYCGSHFDIPYIVVLFLKSHHENGSCWLRESIIHVNFHWLKNIEWIKLLVPPQCFQNWKKLYWANYLDITKNRNQNYRKSQSNILWSWSIQSNLIINQFLTIISWKLIFFNHR
jgi:hypothetical protein